MELWTEITCQGISLRLSDKPPEKLKRDPRASQDAPRGHYIYAHHKGDGVPFYIGKGIGRRAWDDSRHPLWHRYVEKHLDGKYTVAILADDLSQQQAKELESEWIAQEADTLLNWINFGRKTDFEALDRFHKLRDENRTRIHQAKLAEKTDPELAVSQYYKALHAIADYAKISTERGLIGALLEEERDELGHSGELVVLDRLTLCLIRLGRGQEAMEVAAQYFLEYQADERLSGAAPIKKRVARAAPRVGKPVAQDKVEPI